MGIFYVKPPKRTTTVATKQPHAASAPGPGRTPQPARPTPTGGGGLRVERNAEGVLQFRQPMGPNQLVTWSIYPKGEEILRGAKVREGQPLPEGMFARLRDGGHLYTRAGKRPGAASVRAGAASTTGATGTPTPKVRVEINPSGGRTFTVYKSDPPSVRPAMTGPIPAKTRPRLEGPFGTGKKPKVPKQSKLPQPQNPPSPSKLARAGEHPAAPPSPRGAGQPPYGGARDSASASAAVSTPKDAQSLGLPRSSRNQSAVHPGWAKSAAQIASERAARDSNEDSTKPGTS